MSKRIIRATIARDEQSQAPTWAVVCVLNVTLHTMVDAPMTKGCRLLQVSTESSRFHTQLPVTAGSPCAHRFRVGCCCVMRTKRPVWTGHVSLDFRISYRQAVIESSLFRFDGVTLIPWAPPSWLCIPIGISSPVDKCKVKNAAAGRVQAVPMDSLTHAPTTG